MGGAVSAGEDNEELVDKLVNAHYIKSPSIELFFRMIDRGFYFLPSHRTNAYRDQAWRFNSIHISAPCIYSEVLEALQVKPGMSFLNVGSGTGYLSTLVGLLLGARGINHGIELNRDVLKYSQNKLHEFLRHSPAVYLYDFVEPQFILGNAITILSDDPSRHQYDRVYCGAAVPPELESFMKSLLTIGGILVMPANDQLTQVTRISADEYESKSLLAVTFASLVLPCNSASRASRLSKAPADTTKNSSDEEEHLFSLKIPDNQPMSLKLLCRDTIIRLIRKTVESDPAFANKLSSHVKLQSTGQASQKGKRFPKCLFHSTLREVEVRSRSHGTSGTSSKGSSSDTSNSDSFTSNSASTGSSSSSATSHTASVCMSGSSTGSSSTASSSDSNSLSASSSNITCHSCDEAACISTDDNQRIASGTLDKPATGETNSKLLHNAAPNCGQSISLTSSSPAESTDTDDSDDVDVTSEMWRYNCIRKFVAQRRARDAERKADELAAVNSGENVDTSDPSPGRADRDDIAGESSSGDSGLSGVTGVASLAECPSKRSLSQTEEETGETATSGSSAGHVDSGRGSGLVSEPVLIARLRQRAIEGLRHRRRVKARRIAIYSTDSDDSETQEATDSSSVATSSSNRRRGARGASDDAESTDSSEEERRRNEEANLLIAPWSGNPLIPAIVKKIKQLPLPPTLQVYVNFCRPLKGDP